MLWIYHRDKDVLQIETVFDNATQEFVLVMINADGTERRERFKTGEDFQVRLDALEQQLEQERWHKEGQFVLKDGWKI